MTGRRMIKEFQTDPEFTYLPKPWVDGQPNYENKWHGKISIDLKWVSAAQPIGTYTSVLMAGSGQWVSINEDYSRFMFSWMGERGENQ